MSIAARMTDVPHPGQFIAEELEARGWLQRDLAFILGMPEQAVNMIISGKRGISPEMAKALGDAFDVPAEFLSNLQNAYEMARARAWLIRHPPIRPPAQTQCPRSACQAERDHGGGGCA